MELFHLDTDVLIVALSRTGPERRRLLALASADAEIEIAAIAWYEFCRGPRTPDQVAVAHSFFGEDGIVPLTESRAAEAGKIFRSLGSPRRRAADIAIATTAVFRGATLLSRNRADFADVPDLLLEVVVA